MYIHYSFQSWRETNEGMVSLFEYPTKTLWYVTEKWSHSQQVPATNGPSEAMGHIQFSLNFTDLAVHFLAVMCASQSGFLLRLGKSQSLFLRLNILACERLELTYNVSGSQRQMLVSPSRKVSIYHPLPLQVKWWSEGTIGEQIDGKSLKPDQRTKTLQF